MNIQHLKYAVEVEKTRSINRAAENLYMAQPNLSRAIRELEESLGITIFRRNSRGITVTPQGAEFLVYAKRILAQIDEMEARYSGEGANALRFSASVPRCGYIAAAFAKFASGLDPARSMDLRYREVNTRRVLEDVFREDSHLGILRYQKIFERNFQEELAQRELECMLIAEYTSVITISAESHLAEKEILTPNDLTDGVLLILGDAYIPVPPRPKAQNRHFRRVQVFERGSQVALLHTLPGAYYWGAPAPVDIQKSVGLAQRPFSGNARVFRDMLIWRRDYTLTDLDCRFLEVLKEYAPASEEQPE